MVLRDTATVAVQAPDIVFAGDQSSTFTYVPMHLEYMLTELLKNSMRATVETHGHKKTMPAVKLSISYGKEDVSIKITDEGGGIPRSVITRMFG